MPFDPFEQRIRGLEGQIELVAIVGDEREAEQAAADAIDILCRESIALQRCWYAVQSSVGSGLPFRQRS